MTIDVKSRDSILFVIPGSGNLSARLLNQTADDALLCSSHTSERLSSIDVRILRFTYPIRVVYELEGLRGHNTVEDIEPIALP